MLVIGGMAGAASFTHVHDWTMHNSPPGTSGWFGWANAIISELTPTAAGLEIRRRKRTHRPIAYPATVLAAAAALSLTAQVAEATPSPTGWLVAAVPALAFLALTKLVLSRTPAQQPTALAGTPHGEPPRLTPIRCRTGSITVTASGTGDRRPDGRLHPPAGHRPAHHHRHPGRPPGHPTRPRGPAPARPGRHPTTGIPSPVTAINGTDLPTGGRP